MHNQLHNCTLFMTPAGHLSFRRNTQTLPSGVTPLKYDDSNQSHRAVWSIAESWNWEYCGASYPARLPIDPETCERAAGVPTI